jgi:DNA-binding MarR family transcriptional regulator
VLNIPPGRDRQLERDLRILSAIDEGAPLTQRALAERLNVALGLANLCLKRLARKGYIKVVRFNDRPAARKRLRYLLTPKGLAEKSRLTYEHTIYALNLYRRTRQTLREALGGLGQRGLKRIALYGTGDAAELAYLTLKECGLEPVGVFARDGGATFLGFAVQPLGALDAQELDGLVIATFDRPEPHLAEVEQAGVSRDKCLTLRRLTNERTA